MTVNAGLPGVSFNRNGKGVCARLTMAGDERPSYGGEKIKV